MYESDMSKVMAKNEVLKEKVDIERRMEEYLESQRKKEIKDQEKKIFVKNMMSTNLLNHAKNQQFRKQ